MYGVHVRRTCAMNVYTMIHVRRTPVRRTCTAYMYHSVNTLLLTLANAVALIKVDYRCSILSGVSDHVLDRLQSVLNAADRLMFSARGDGVLSTSARFSAERSSQLS